MAVIGLTIFSIAIAIFSAFHSAQIPFIRQQVDYPVRLLGSAGFGFALTSLEKLAENAFKTGYKDVDPQPSGLPESSTPHLDALTMPLSEFPHNTAGSDEDFDAEELGKTPVTDFQSMPNPTVIIVVERPVTEITQDPPAYSDPAALMDYTPPKKTAPPKAEHFGKLNVNINWIVLTTYISLFVTFIAYLFFLRSVTRATYRDSLAKIDQAAAKAKEEMETLTSETQSYQARLMRALEIADKEVEKTISEIPSHKSRLLAMIDEAEKEMNQEIGRCQESFEKTRKDAKIGEELLKGAVTEMGRQHLRLPNFQVLLNKEFDPFKEEVTEAKAEVEKLVAGAMQHVKAQMNEVLKDGLGDLAEKRAQEKERVADDLRKLEEIKISLPETPILGSRVFMLEQDVITTTREVERLEERAKECLSGLPGLKLRSDEIEGAIKNLETNHGLQKLALSRLRADQMENRKKLEEAGLGKPAVSGDSPVVPAPDLPADLERDLLGESSSSEAEETGGEGDEERTEGPEELAGDGEDASGPKSPVRGRRSRPNGRQRAKMRAQAQAVPPSSEAGGGDDDDDAGSGGKERDS